ncbi:MAG: transposase, partial [Robiginitomaculum sp.]|nr:transposase [Robiginitomaculum sp.]
SLPTSEYRIRELAIRENWGFRKREGRGGGREYAYASLPQHVHITLAQMKRSKARFKPAPKSSVDANVKGDARAYILEDIDDLCMRTAMSRHAAAGVYCIQYEAQDLTAPDWVFEALPHINQRTIRGWFLIRERDGNSGLIDVKNGPKNQSMFDQNLSLKSWILSNITAKPHIRCSVLHEGLAAAGFDPLPSLRSLQNYVRNWKHKNARPFLAVSDPDAYRSKHEVAFGSRSAHLTRVNELWEIDGTIADVHSLSPSGERTRYCLTGLIDVFSRRTLILVSRQPSAVAVGLLLREAILKWGLPEVLKADNGKDYTAQHVQRIAVDLGFKINYCTPFRPMEKPHIERFFGTLTRDLFEILPGYAGHSVADANALRSMRSMGERHGALQSFDMNLNGGELQTVINSWVDDKYAQSVHRGIKTTPFLKGQEGGKPRLFKDERALDLLLAASPGKDGIRTIQKDGIHVNDHTYISYEMGGMVGEKVHVKFDPDDEAKIIVYSADREDFICIAVDPTMTDIDRLAVAKRAKQAQNQENKVFRGEMKAAQDAHNPEELAASILTARIKNSSTVIPFKKPTDMPDTPAFVRERKAAAAHGAPVPSPQPITEQQAQARVDYLAEIDERENPEIIMLKRADGSMRPAIVDDIEYINYLQVEHTKPAGIHPEDITDLREYLSDGGRALEMCIEANGLTEFVNKITGEME